MKMASALYSLKAWKSISSEACSRLYGVEGSGVFRRQGKMVLLEKHYSPTNPRTSFQQHGRSMVASAVASWQGLPAESKAYWENKAKWGRTGRVMSGYNLYISKFLLGGGPP